jgi:hypothetical protein
VLGAAARACVSQQGARANSIALHWLARRKEPIFSARNCRSAASRLFMAAPWLPLFADEYQDVAGPEFDQIPMMRPVKYPTAIASATQRIVVDCASIFDYRHIGARASAPP